MQTDEELLSKIRTGNNEAFTALLAAKERALYSVAFKILRCREDAEDAVMAAFEELCEKVHTIRSGAALTAWLMTTVKHKAFDILRKNSRAFPADDDVLERGRGSVSPDYAEAVHIGECLKKLPADQFDVLSLYGYGLKLREIAVLTGKPVTTVWTTLKKAKEGFAKLYER